MIKPKIDRNSKILSISHADGDGVACQIILGQVFKNIKYLNTAFYKVDKILESVMFDDYDYVSAFNPPVTALERIDVDMGLKAAELLYNRINGEKSNYKEIRISPELVIRKSCGCK